MLDSATEAALASCRRDLPERLPETHVVHGFDGYCDRVRTMVDARTGPEEYDRMDDLSALSARIGGSVDLGTSCSIEWFTEDSRAGGHTSHFGRAFARLGFEPTLVGTYGDPPRSIFEEELDGCELRSVGSPSYTDAVEFDDGKLMLNEIGSMASLDWERLRERLSVQQLATAIDGAPVLSMGYWATIPFLPTIWRGLRREVWPVLTDPPRTVFVDPADIRRLSTERLTAGLDSLAALDDTVPVVVSANRAETAVFADLGESTATEMREQAIAARELLGVSEFVAHAADRAVRVDEDGTATVRTPHVAKPTLTASAGDHFNVGYVLGQLLGLGGPSSLLLGNAVANWFLRRGEPPTYGELLGFLSRFDSYFE
ncbi:hypothetical protein ACFQL1_22825 [Halomicroarcula sp. GCM10025709]|uniref:hypothetical protein n=1 Tax=Haloarcula TaxID=2237 RepID=UPI0024C3F2F1|nr:hypothetical protein [Halomicroarcula sp. YJ-61-S]